MLFKRHKLHQLECSVDGQAILIMFLLKSIVDIMAQFFHWKVLLILTNDNVMHLPLQYHAEKFY